MGDLLTALREHGKARPRRPEGEGWYTLAELADAEKVASQEMKYRINVARKNGIRVEIAHGTAYDGSGRAKRTTYYRLGKL